MRFCQKCILPDTRPNLVIGKDGVCNACKSHATKAVIDWQERARAFSKVVERAKSLTHGYDCVIPVSGGKDSTWQVVHCLQHGLHPLAVTWRSPVRTPVGEANLKNLIGLGVDHIDFQINPKVEKKFLLESFVRYGTPMIPMHMALFSIPLQVAVNYRIPLVIWGENSAFEYGSKDQATQGFQMNEAWLKQFGVTQGTTASDWVSEQLTIKELTPYFTPSDEELRAANVLSIFLGYYFAWDPAETFAVAKAHGFQAESKGPRTGYYDYADIDDDFISIHHYLKWYKFGFTRLFDNLSLEIRNGRMSRDQAVEIVKQSGEQTPKEDIRAFCDYVGIKERRFFEIAESFRSAEIWKKQGQSWQLVAGL